MAVSYYKVTAMYQWAGQGWSESIYTQQSTMTAAQTAAIAYVNTRMALMPSDCMALAARCSVQGARFVSMTLRSDSFLSNGQGLWGGTDTPPSVINGVKDAVLLSLYPAATTFNRFFFRGLPDELCKNGYFVPSMAWNTAFGIWFDNLTTNAYRIRVYNKGDNTYSYPLIATYVLDTLIRSRAVGRPFGQLVGRRMIR